MGSPPRVREKLINHYSNTVNLGITPACAGKTKIVFSNSSTFWDHPRVCGKNSNGAKFIRNLLGSPPRVREKLIFSTSELFLLGITPACAGKTLKDPNEIKTFLSS